MAVSITLVAGALVGTAGVVSASANLERSTRETRSATRASSLLMERLRSTDFDSLVADFDGRTMTVSELVGKDDAGGDAIARVSIREIDNGSARWTLYQVTVDVTSEQFGAERDLQLVTYVSDRASSSSSLGGANQQEPDSELEGGSLAAESASQDNGGYDDEPGESTASSEPTEPPDDDPPSETSSSGETTAAADTSSGGPPGQSGKEKPGNGKGRTK